MNIKQVSKDFFKGIVGAIEVTGAGEIIELVMRVFMSCHPIESGEKCNNFIIKTNIAAATTLSWLDYFIQWMSLLAPCKASRIPEVWNNATDIVKIWNFYLQAAFALDAEINGQDHQTDDRWETPLIFLSTLFLAVITNPDLREHIRNRFYSGTEKGYVAKFVDGATGFLRGFAYGRALINTFETVGDAFAESSFTFSRLGRVLRYTWGGVWGIVVGGIHLKSSSHVSTAAALPTEFDPRFKKWMNRGNDLFTTTTFTALLVANMRKLESQKMIGFSIGLSMLAPAILVRCLYKDHVSSGEDTDPDMPPLVEEGAEQGTLIYTPSEHLPSYTSLVDNRNTLFNLSHSTPLLSDESPVRGMSLNG